MIKVWAQAVVKTQTPSTISTQLPAMPPATRSYLPATRSYLVIGRDEEWKNYD